tara:strand:- start:7785 stop:8336 length:552 start_codon:yes stop_codon:yes gene_type:complete
MYSLILIKITDLIIALILLIFFLPFFLIIPFLIIFFDRGPIFYRSIRIGKNGKKINFLKFKTMINNNITPIGKYLRRTSFDEIPQLIHVLTGHMSIVGPRPVTPEIEKTFDNDDLILRRTVKPGITGYSQIYYEGKKRTWKKKIKYDVYYINNLNYYFYLQIILKTFKVLFIRFTKNKRGDTL